MTNHIPANKISPRRKPLARWIGRTMTMAIAGVTLSACNSDDTLSYKLNLNMENDAAGVITVTPDYESYRPGSKVTLTVAENPGYLFDSWQWGRDSSSSEHSVTLTMDRNMNVTAEFERGVIIELAQALNGQYTIEPDIESGTTVSYGSEFTITATPDDGYVLDSVYKMLWVIEYGDMYGWSYYADESFTSPYTVKTDPDDARFKVYGGELGRYVLGASFIAEDTWGELNETLNVEYAKPGSKSLKYDVYAPPGAEELPIIVIVHGGGWAMNNEDIMRGQARYMAQTGNYVVVSIDYRLTTDLDDPAPTQVDMVNDVFGAIAHIQEHAATYGGDPNRLIMTGDSAGGHLSSSAGLLARYIGDGGYTGEVGSSEFMPTYVPDGLSVHQLRDNIDNAIIAIIPSYGAFSGMEAAIEPMSNIPDISERALPPHYLQVGSEDTTTTPESIRRYRDKLHEQGQEAYYVEYQGAEHAYLDWKPEPAVHETFNTYGKKAMDDMMDFLDNVMAKQK